MLFLTTIDLLRITFQLTDIDWPSCINYIEFDYYDTVYNESVYMETVRSPLPDVVEIQIVNKNVPCGEDFAHFTRVSLILTLRHENCKRSSLSGLRRDGRLVAGLLDAALVRDHDPRPHHARLHHHHHRGRHRRALQGAVRELGAEGANQFTEVRTQEHSLA